MDVRSDIRLGSSGQFRAAAGEENLRIIRSTVSENGVILAGSGFTVQHPDNATYVVAFNTPFAGRPSVTATTERDSDVIVRGRTIITNGVTSSKVTFNIRNTETSEWVNSEFHFIAVGPR